MTQTTHTVRIDTALWADAPKDAIADILAADGLDLRIEAEGVSSLSALQAQILVAAQRWTHGAGRSFELSGVSAELRSSLTLLGLAHIIQRPEA
jgi:anti-anti-sigma regulatory factor